MSFVFIPLEKVTGRFNRAAEEQTVFVAVIFFHFSLDGRMTMMTWRVIRLLISPHPKGTRFFFNSTHEERTSVIILGQIFYYVHFCVNLVSWTYGVRLFRGSPSADGFFVQATFILRANEVTRRLLSTKPKGPLVGGNRNGRFSM